MIQPIEIRNNLTQTHPSTWRTAVGEPIAEDEDEDLRDIEARRNVKYLTYLGYTSNMISCGVRESILYLVKNKLVNIAHFDRY